MAHNKITYRIIQQGISMIKKIKASWLFMSIMYMAQSWAVVINMEEFYSPVSQQTVILMGDLHATASESDDLQYHALFNAVKKYNAQVIIEGRVDNDSWGDDRVLARFAYNCWIERIPVSNIEFRKHVDSLMHLAKYANNCTKMDEIESFFEKYAISKIDIFDAFIKMGIESSRVRIEIAEFIRTLKALPQKNMFENELLYFIQGALNKYDQIVQEIESAAPYDATYNQSRKHAAVDAMINNFFFERDGHVYTLANSAYDKSFNLQVIFLDLRVIKQMYAHRKERVIFVYTGQAHTRHISTILRAIGFELKFQISNDLEACNLIKDLHRTTELDEVYKSEAMKHCCINVDEFFGFCSTLPQQTELANSSRMLKFLLGTGVIALGAWVAYGLFSNRSGLVASGASAAVVSTLGSSLFKTNQSSSPADAPSIELKPSNKNLYAKTFLASSFLAMAAWMIYGKFGGSDNSRG